MLPLIYSLYLFVYTEYTGHDSDHDVLWQELLLSKSDRKEWADVCSFKYRNRSLCGEHGGRDWLFLGRHNVY